MFQTIMTATTIANRKASNTTSIIRCVHSDPCTGFIEYFVVPMDKKAGRWYSEQSVDLTALIHYRCERRKHFEQLVRTKEAPHTALQSGKKREASTCSVDATAPTKKTRVERGTKKVDSRLQLVLDKHRDDVVRLLNESASGEKSLSTELLEELRSKNLIEMRRENLLVYQEGGDLLEEFELRNRLTESEKESKKKVLADRRRGLSEKKRAFQAVFNQHRDDIRNLVKDSYARGEASVDINLIEIARAKNLVDLRSANILVEQFGGKLLSEDELKSQMTSAETQALRLIELDKKSAEKKVRAAARQKEANLKDRERELRRAIEMHRDVTVCLMKTCAARGEAVVSTMLIEKARSQNLVGIRAANLFVHKAGGKLLGEIELKIELAKAEQAASKLYQRDVKGQDRQSQSSTKRAAPTNSALVQPPVKKMKDEGLQDKEREFQAALNRHRDDTIRLMKECASRGESGVSIEDMTATRSKNILALENANRSIHQAGGAKLVDMELKVRMSRAEKEAVDMYVQEVRSRLSS